MEYSMDSNTPAVALAHPPIGQSGIPNNANHRTATIDNLINTFAGDGRALGVHSVWSIAQDRMPSFPEIDRVRGEAAKMIVRAVTKGQLIPRQISRISTITCWQPELRRLLDVAEFDRAASNVRQTSDRLEVEENRARLVADAIRIFTNDGVGLSEHSLRAMSQNQMPAHPQVDQIRGKAAEVIVRAIAQNHLTHQESLWLSEIKKLQPQLKLLLEIAERRRLASISTIS